MNFAEIINKIPVVKEDVNFWMVRTSGGRFYDQFLSNNKIAMGNDYITPEKVKSFSTKRENFLNLSAQSFKSTQNLRDQGLQLISSASFILRFTLSMEQSGFSSQKVKNLKK